MFKLALLLLASALLLAPSESAPPGPVASTGPTTASRTGTQSTHAASTVTTARPTTTTAPQPTTTVHRSPTTTAHPTTTRAPTTSSSKTTGSTTLLSAISTSSGSNTVCNDFRAIDVAFLLDSSSIFTNASWNLLLQYVSALVDMLPVSSDGVRIALVTYANDAFVRFKFSDSFDKAAIKSSIMSTPFNGGNQAFIGHALNVVGNSLFLGSAGYRGGLAAVVVMTASVSQENPVLLNADVIFIQSLAEVIVVGIGSAVSIAQINQVASGPATAHAFFFSLTSLGAFMDATTIVQAVGCPSFVTSSTAATSEIPNFTQSTPSTDNNCDQNCPVYLFFTILADYNVRIAAQNDISIFDSAIIGAFPAIADRLWRVTISPNYRGIGVSMAVNQSSSAAAPNANAVASSIVASVNAGNVTIDYKNQSYAALPGSASLATQSQNDDNGLSGGAIAGIVIGCVVGALLILLLLVAIAMAASRRRNGPIVTNTTANRAPPQRYAVPGDRYQSSA